MQILLTISIHCQADITRELRKLSTIFGYTVTSNSQDKPTKKFMVISWENLLSDLGGERVHSPP